MSRTPYVSHRVDRVKGPWRAGLAVLTVGLLASGVAVTGGGSADAVRGGAAASNPSAPGSGAHARGRGGAHGRGRPQRVDAAQARSFTILRDEPSTPSALPAPVRRVLGREASATLHGARRAGTAADGETLYVVPAPGRICVVTGGGLLSCSRTTDAAAGRVVLAQRRQAGALLVGVVPDGVADVEIAGPDGTARAKVERNAWSASVAFEPTSVVWERAEHRHEVPVRLPPDGAAPGDEG